MLGPRWKPTDKSITKGSSVDFLSLVQNKVGMRRLNSSVCPAEEKSDEREGVV